MKNKIIIVTALLGFVNAFLKEDILYYKSKGLKVICVANPSKKETLDKVLELGVVFVPINFNSKKPLSLSNLKTLKPLKKLFDDKDILAIHFHTPISSLYGRLASKKYRKKYDFKVIYTTHGFAFTKRSSKMDFVKYYLPEKFLSKYTDCIITINEDDYNFAKMMKCPNVKKIKGYGLRENIIIDEGLDVVQYRKSLGVLENQIMVLSIGELSVRKNHKIIIEALATIPNKEQYVFVIAGKKVGRAPIDEQLKSLAIQKGVNLRLLGYREDISEIIQCCDFGAMPSHREGLGLAGLEILHCGKPVIGTNVQGIKEYIVDDLTGYLCEDNSVLDFKNAIIKLSNEELRTKMIEDCIRKSNEFSLQKSVESRITIYEDLLFS